MRCYFTLHEYTIQHLELAHFQLTPTVRASAVYKGAPHLAVTRFPVQAGRRRPYLSTVRHRALFVSYRMY